MARGLVWLPLLALFIGLAWAGWNEFRKVEAFRAWAASFEAAKYDLYSVLGLTPDHLVVGKPTRQGPIDLETIALAQIQGVYLRLDGQRQPDAAVDPAVKTAVDGNERARCIELCLELGDRIKPIRFTEVDRARAWTAKLLSIQGELR